MDDEDGERVPMGPKKMPSDYFRLQLFKMQGHQITSMLSDNVFGGGGGGFVVAVFCLFVCFCVFLFLFVFLRRGEGGGVCGKV